MLLPGYEGPKEQWHAELQSVNRFGLLCFIDSLVLHLDCITGGMKRDSLLDTVRTSKKFGKWDAGHARHMRLMENPRKFIDEQIRRSQAGKRAARRRKKALREAAR
jgi:hypothetical protein